MILMYAQIGSFFCTQYIPETPHGGYTLSANPPNRPELNEENIRAALKEHGTFERASVIGLGRSPAAVYVWLKKQGLRPKRITVLVPVEQPQERAG